MELVTRKGSRGCKRSMRGQRLVRGVGVKVLKMMRVMVVMMRWRWRRRLNRQYECVKPKSNSASYSKGPCVT